MPDKGEVLRLLRASIEADHASIVGTHKAITDGTVHEESRAENDKDTRAIESSYLARGLALRAAELSGACARLAVFALRAFPLGSPVAMGALVKIEDEDTEQERWYFLAPAGGGVRVEVGGVSVAIVTPGAPICDALLGKCVDDGFELRTPSGIQSCRVVELR